MNTSFYKELLAFCCIVLLALPFAVESQAGQMEGLTYQKVLERILKTYPTLQIAQLRIAQAQQDLDKVKSQLGWNLLGQAGVAHDVSSLGTPVDRTDVSGSLERKMLSGNSIDLSGRYSYEDNSLTLSPQLPNPSHTTSVDLNFRMPLARGQGNVDYQQGLEGAYSSIEASYANEQQIRDGIARQAMELFYAAALTRARIENANLGIARAKRLKNYVNKRAALGLAEEKDILQTEAQLRGQISEHRSLLVIWERQRTSLNRLMGRVWNQDFEPILLQSDLAYLAEREAIIESVMDNSPEIKTNRAILRQAEATLARSRDKRKETMDLVLSVGARAASGDNNTGSVSEQDVAGGIRFEYQEALDKRGLDAEVKQANLDRTIAFQEIELLQEDIRYKVSGIIAEIIAAQGALNNYELRLETEERKFREALQRYRVGRAETDRLIQFENDLHLARLAVEQQRIELSEIVTDLDLLQGTLWHSIRQ